MGRLYQVSGRQGAEASGRKSIEPDHIDPRLELNLASCLTDLILITVIKLILHRIRKDHARCASWATKGLDLGTHGDMLRRNGRFSRSERSSSMGRLKYSVAGCGKIKFREEVPYDISNQSVDRTRSTNVGR